MKPLICCNCAGPLPAPTPNASHLTCAFCDTTSALAGERQPVASPQAQSSALEIRQRYAAELDAFEAAVGKATLGKQAQDAFHAAAATTLGRLCDPTTLTHVVFGIAREFGDANNVDLTGDPISLSRLAIAYLGALEHVRRDGRHTMKIPYFATTPQGPVNFEETLTVQRSEELARIGATPKKRGFFGRLFG